MYANMTTNLMVESVDESAKFYQDILGFTMVASVPAGDGQLQFAILAKDNLSLMLQEKKNMISEYPILNTPKVQPSITLYIAVDNLEELYTAFQEKDLIISEMHQTFYGSKEFAIADNSGYVLTFTENKQA